MKISQGQEQRADGRAWAILRSVPRAAEWWEYKLVPILAIFYATAMAGGAQPVDLWRTALVLLAALAPGALYVSVLNDLTDRKDGAAAGKPNRMVLASPLLATALLAIPLAVGALFLALWRDSPGLQLAYLAAWIVFTLYSLPPARLKRRGLAGVLADAAGSNLFPVLVALGLVWRVAGEPSVAWGLAAGAWALAFGVRGILWHQLGDRDNDAAAGVRTFAVLHSQKAVLRLGRAAAALELAALAWLLVQLGSWAAVAALGVYLVAAGLKFVIWRILATLTEPGADRQLAGGDYYDVILPLALLLSASAQDPRNLFVLAAHLVVFPNRWRVFVSELAALCDHIQRRTIKRAEWYWDRYRARASRQ